MENLVIQDISQKFPLDNYKNKNKTKFLKKNNECPDNKGEIINGNYIVEGFKPSTKPSTDGDLNFHMLFIIYRLYYI